MSQKDSLAEPGTITPKRDVQEAQHVAEQATVQTALVMARALGIQQSRKTGARRGGPEHGTLRRHATTHMRAVIDSHYPQAAIRFLDKGPEGEEEKADSAKLMSATITTSNSVCRLHWALVPLDGSNALHEGESGSVAIAAVGEPDCFKIGGGYKEFLGVTVGPQRLANSEVTRALDECHAGKSKMKLMDAANEGVGLINLLAQPTSGDQPPDIALLFEGDDFKDFRVQIRGLPQRRRLRGSAFVAAHAALDAKLNCSAFICRLPQLVTIATATLGFGGRLYAYELTHDGTRHKNGMRVLDGFSLDLSQVLRESDVIDVTKHVAVAVTSISEVCSLDRVRYRGEAQATTDSIVISSPLRMITRTTRTIDLREQVLVDTNYRPVVANNVLEDFSRELTAKKDVS